MKSLKFILVLIFCYGSSRSSAQTASLYSAKRLVGVYSTIQAAVDAAMPYDSIVLSADVFIENDILFRYDRFPLRINGTVNKTDTTRININKKSKVFINFLGNLSNVIIENIDTIISKRPFPNCSISLSGYISFRNSIFNYSPLFYDLYEISNCHFDFSKNIISIRNELPPYEIPNYLILIDYFTKVSNSNFNVNYNNIIYPKKLAVIQIETEIDNIGIDIFKNIGGVGLYLGPGFHHLESVITQSFKHVNIYSNSFNSGKDYASLNIYSGDLSKKFNLIINNSYIYNPAPVGQKRIELYCDNSANLSFESSDTW